MRETAPSNASARGKSDARLHFVLLSLISGLWCVTVILAFVPNNRLHDLGLGSAVAIDLTAGALFALLIAILSIRHRETCPSRVLFALVQVLAWGHSIGIWLLIFIGAFVALLQGGV
ncbi:MAG TPA: hypothetical protein VF665_05490 [Longimicrobium sp.]|jgi:hypothetical protein|uniref:hypothetical protein n=1 Tax=Longimicrobium sp. TaxID=2029185 RepID=UPI002ED98EDB